MDHVKNRGRNKFSSCFNPIVGEDEPCFHSPPPTPSFDPGESRWRKKPPHHSLSGFVKAVFFKTPLLKKLGSKRSKRDSYISSKIKRLTKKKKIPSSKKFSDPQEVYFQDNSDRSSLFSSTSSSRASSISSNSTSGSERIKASSDCVGSDPTSTSIIRHAMKLVSSSSSKCDRRGLMFIILVCLVALVFWGKAFAIVTCTWVWLFLAPGQGGPQAGGPRANNVVGSEEYKKRVIMAGLLERNIRPRLVQ